MLRRAQRIVSSPAVSGRQNHVAHLTAVSRRTGNVGIASRTCARSVGFAALSSPPARCMSTIVPRGSWVRGFERSEDGLPIKTYTEDEEVADVLNERKINFAIPYKRVTELQAGEWRPGLRRTGVVARKIGQCNMYDDWGVQFGATIVQVQNCHVVMVNPQRSNQGMISMMVGGGLKNEKRMNSALRGVLRAAGTPPMRRFCSFPISPCAALPAGTRLTVQHFVPGQFVDVQGTTRGKGFQGVMKRWGFRGQPASHGASKSHRSLGSTGGANTPVRKGKKMPGRMGGKNATAKCLLLYKIDVEKQLLYLKGTVPGAKESMVFVKDAVFKRRQFLKKEIGLPPYPTFIPDKDATVERVLKMPKPEKNPAPGLLI